MKKIAFLSTHPVQYQVPLYRELAKQEDIDLTVFYCHKPTAHEQGIGFGIAFKWDMDLLNGYRSVFLKNISPKPSLQKFGGCDCPDIKDYVKKENFDVFIIMGWYVKAYWQAFYACWKFGIPMYVRGDSQLDPTL